ncbi:hypothetical protein [Actinocrispum sp. NPDC049592]|uniref:hypothetical protein n=1 Tax=Actinocrispum sp. NPDC049592 TaxID=3154835 RepID=UPI00341BE5B2
MATRVSESRILLGPDVTRDQVMERARSWLTEEVPYSQTELHTNQYGRYRADCSGYVSMAWGLPGHPMLRDGGLNTFGLAAVSYPVHHKDLLPGDVLLRSDGTNITRHVVIFDRWASRNSYWGFEQAGDSGTTYRVQLYPQRLYMPRRYVRIMG